MCNLTAYSNSNEEKFDLNLFYAIYTTRERKDTTPYFPETESEMKKLISLAKLCCKACEEDDILPIKEKSQHEAWSSFYNHFYISTALGGGLGNG